jgi:hypothetical protein
MAEEPTPTDVAQPNSVPAAEPTPTDAQNTPPAPADGDDSTLIPNLDDEGNLQNQDPKPADGEPEPADKKPTGAPEKYDDFTLPEGFTWDDARKGEAATLFKELDLPQDKAQKLVDAYCKAAKDQQTAAETELMNLRKQWRSEVQARPDFREQRALAEKGMRKVITTPAQRKLLNGSWLQDSPEFFDMFVTIGKLFAEDNMDGRNTPPPQKTESQINLERFPGI